MATVIRFSRHGTKKKPYFRLVVQNKTAPRDGRFIEHIGSFTPQKGDLKVERDRLEYWLSVGAKLSDSVKNRLKAAKTAGTEVPHADPTKPPAPPKAKIAEKKKKTEAAKEA